MLNNGSFRYTIGFAIVDIVSRFVSSVETPAAAQYARNQISSIRKQTRNASHIIRSWQAKHDDRQ